MSDCSITRRQFVKQTSTVLGAAALATQLGTRVMAQGPAAGADTLGVALIGCGGRGTGALNQCLGARPGVKLVAMGDLFQDRLDACRARLAKLDLGARNAVTDERCFVGFDAYKQVLACPEVDLVLLTTPPGFRPLQLQAAVAAGKHVFMEKPVAVDPVGVRSVIASGKLADVKGLSIVAGTQYRRQDSYVKAIERIHAGDIGKLLGAQGYYNSGPLWHVKRTAAMSDMEWQCRNWYYFTWLSGDHLVEQCIHNVDALNWVFQGPPLKVLGSGGRIVRTGPEYGHVYDHFVVEYEYPGDARVMVMCRQMANTATKVANHIIGTEGIANVNPQTSDISSHEGKRLFRHPERGRNPYVQEHIALLDAIRHGPPVNDTAGAAESTLTAIMGREAAYTGKEITWEQITASDLDLSPSQYEFGDLPQQPVPTPGTARRG
jgi:predicted dehydrogenase